MIDPLDRRRNAIRDDLADIRLRDRVERPAYSTGRPMVVRTTSAGCLVSAGGQALDTQFLCGEPVTVFALEDDEFVDPVDDRVIERKDHWAWAQSMVDGYVGYVEAAALAEPGPPPTHIVSVPEGLVYHEPGVAAPFQGPLPMGARVRVLEVVERAEMFAQVGQLESYRGRPGEHGPLCRVGEGIYVRQDDLRPLGEMVEDWVAIAERFVGTPYLWGGKTVAGIDCSGLVQLALQASGRAAPRDSDMQAEELGEALPADAPLQRGDLIFWKGHVGVMSSGTLLLHANGHHKSTVFEPLAETVARLEGMDLPVTVRRRLDG